MDPKREAEQKKIFDKDLIEAVVKQSPNKLLRNSLTTPLRNALVFSLPVIGRDR